MIVDNQNKKYSYTNKTLEFHISIIKRTLINIQTKILKLVLYQTTFILTWADQYHKCVLYSSVMQLVNFPQLQYSKLGWLVGDRMFEW